MTPKPDYERDGVTMYCADCRDILPHLSGVDAVVTDPPYGIKAARANFYSRGNLAPATDFGHADWDDEPADQSLLHAIVDMAKYAIVWGGNFYQVPPSSCWLVWDKKHLGQDFADAELAWTNLKGAVRKIDFLWAGMWQENMKAKEQRFHPTQKPVPVIEWCIEKLPSDAETILDPFMGSGTTGVACIRTGRKFIGIERERKYFDIAVKRIEAEFDRAPLFSAQEKEVQVELFGDAP